MSSTSHPPHRDDPASRLTEPAACATHHSGMRNFRDLLIGGVIAMATLDGGAAEPDAYANARERMVEQQMQERDIRDARVLAAMRKVPRHRFVPQGEQRYAYSDTPLPIGEGQTISQ